MIRFINPNYHVILIHYPIALLGLGLLIELLGWVAPLGSLRTAGRWMALLGALATAPAATSGIFAKYDVIQQLAGGQEGNWRDIQQAAHLSGLQWHFLNLHVLCSAIGAGIATLAAIVWLGSSPQWPRPMGVGIFILLAAAMGLMTFGAYNAGEMIYRTQFATQSQEQSDKSLNDWQDQTHAATGADKFQRELEFYVDTMQTHVIAAGFVFAFCAAGIGVSFQKSAQLRQTTPPAEADAAVAAPVPIVATAPAARMWLATAIIALATITVGWYVLVHDLPTPMWNVKAAFISQISQPFHKDSANGTRPLAHLILGGGILILSLLLIPLTHWFGRGRALIGLLSLIMLAAVAAQIYVGVMMMYDTDSGPLLHFNPASSAGGPGLVAGE